jgi:hypothetical protein
MGQFQLRVDKGVRYVTSTPVRHTRQQGTNAGKQLRAAIQLLV